MPKFLQEDLKLFAGIVSDLFPTIKEEETDYGILDQAIRKACVKNNLKDVEGELQSWDSCRPWHSSLSKCWLQPSWSPGFGDRDRAVLSQGPSLLTKMPLDLSLLVLSTNTPQFRSSIYGRSPPNPKSPL